MKSRTWFVITFVDCPVYWASKFQTETALSTTESDINSLNHSCRELFQIIDITKSPSQVVELTICDTTMNVSIHEDNSGALILEKTSPTQFIPRRKYYASKTIWFCEEIKKGESSSSKLILLRKWEIYSPKYFLGKPLNISKRIPYYGNSKYDFALERDCHG